MRGPVLLLVLLVAIPAFSGCIFIAPDRPEALPLETTPDWSVPVGMLGRPLSGAYGVWVPDNSTALRARWAATPDEPAANVTARGDLVRVKTSPEHEHTERPHGVLGHLPDLLVVIAPDGSWRYAGSGSVRLPLGNDSASRPPALTKDVLFQDTPPLPGLYRFIVYGAHALPLIELKGPSKDRTVPAAPLPLIVDATFFTSTQNGAGSFTNEGSWLPQEGTAAVWGDLRGFGFDARLHITTSQGETAADQRHRVLADGTFLGDGWRMPGVDDGGQISPDVLHDRSLTWTATGIGSGTAHGFAAVVPFVDAPWTPPADADHRTTSEESTPLEGRLDRGDAGGLVLPDGARVRLVLADTDSDARDHARYRIYAADGQRLAWGTVDRDDAAPLLPAGPLAIVNDGPGALEVHIDGSAPADAVLHPLPKKTSDHHTQIGSTPGGPAEARIRAALEGPVTQMYLYQTGTAEDVRLSVLRPDGTAVATAPDLAPYPPGTRPCCGIAGLTSHVGDPHWIDPGVHHLRISTPSGEGEVSVDLTLIDLSKLRDLVQDGN